MLLQLIVLCGTFGRVFRVCRRMILTLRAGSFAVGFQADE